MRKSFLEPGWENFNPLRRRASFEYVIDCAGGHDKGHGHGGEQDPA